uniref:ANK_REP_REGION domain-containing protein n=1 Tax=Anisakis simplex TaxID=6269 RepID=A0A0M3J268_ANISI
LKKCDEREKQMAPPPPRRPRLKFSAEVALLEATSRADAAEVERLLLDGANPNSHNEDGLTPLHQVRSHCHTFLILYATHFLGISISNVG